MIKTLMGSIRDYMKVTVATPLLVLGEVLCEMLIPFITANLIDAIKDGATVAEMLPTAGFLVLIALTSLAFGAAAGVTCSHASCGFAKNLRHDLFYKIQTFSFANIDEFSSSSLVTRLTTDINNVQQAFMMIIRIAVRAPLVLIFAFTMAFIMGGSVAMVYLVIIPLLGFGLFFIIFKDEQRPDARKISRQIFVTAAEEEDIRELVGRGVEVEIRALADDPKVDALSAL